MPIVNGPLLRRMRRWKDETTKEVADNVGIAEGSLRNVESMRGEASDELVGRLSRYLGLPEDEIREMPGKRLPKRGAA